MIFLRPIYYFKKCHTASSHLRKSFRACRSSTCSIKQFSSHSALATFWRRVILASRKLEVQTYRMCQGVLSFARKYSKPALEETCKQALEYGKTTYTFIKNCIPVVAEDFDVSTQAKKTAEERSKGAFVMGAEATDINNLLTRSQNLANQGKGGDE